MTRTPSARCQQQRRHGPSPQDQEGDRCGGEDRVLPRLGEGSRERDGRAEDRPDRGRTCAVEERPHAAVAAQPVEAVSAEQDERERRRERDGGGQEAAADPRGGVAHDGDGLHDRARGDLPERHGVEELAVGHPVVVVDRVGLHQRDDHEAPAVGERADLEGHPGEREQPAAADQDRRDPQGGGRRQGRDARAAAPDDDLDEPAPEQQQDEPRADGRRGHHAGADVEEPAQLGAPAHARPARGHEAPAGVHGDGGDGGTRPGAGALDPQRWVAGQEQHREAEDEDEPGDDEGQASDERADAPALPPGAVDRELRRGRPGQEVAGGDRVLEVVGLHPAAALDAQPAEQGDVGRRSPEPEAPDTAPLAEHDREARVRAHRPRRPAWASIASTRKRTRVVSSSAVR